LAYIAYGCRLLIALASRSGERRKDIVSGDHSVPSGMFCRIQGLIGLPQEPLRANIITGDLGRDADTERNQRPDPGRTVG
jgi:hypothetical protein